MFSSTLPLYTRALQKTSRLQRILSGEARKKFIPQTPEHIAALPAIPPRPETRPTPWLSPSELETYLFPLPTLSPWRSSLRFGATNQLPKALILSGHYWFKDKVGVTQFIQEVKRIAKEENHQPLDYEVFSDNPLTYFKDVSYIKNGRQTMKLYYHVNIKTMTRKAFIPKSILDLRPDGLFPAKDNTPFPEDLIIPGITARDVRLSLLVDQMFRDKFVSTSATSTPTKFSKTGINSLVHHPSNKRINLTDIMSVFRKGFCPCCGLPHLLAKCPVRKEHPPRVKCAHCRGEGHWSVDCGSLEKVASGSL